MFEYSASLVEAIPPRLGYYRVGMLNGEPWWSDSAIALPGTPPPGDTQPGDFKKAVGSLLCHGRRATEPVGFWTLGDGITVVLMSSGVYINSMYFDYVMTRHPNAAICCNRDNTAVLFFDENGQPLAVVRGMLNIEIPDNLCGLIEVPAHA